MKSKNANFKGLKIFYSKSHSDSRGEFKELFINNSIKVNKKFKFTCFSRSKKNVLRGLHLQKPNAQGKYISVIKGKVLDIAVDLRKNSKTFKKYFKIILSSINCKSIYIPEGFAHGGSMRYVIKRKKNEISQNLNKLIEYEKSKKIDKLESCLDFKKNCENSKKTLLKKLNDFKNDGKKICGYAATSKGTTILNYCKIGNNYIEYICDTTKEKIGKFSPGMHIPIVDMNHFKSHQPDCIYLFAWNHKNEILSKEKNFKGEWFSHVAL